MICISSDGKTDRSNKIVVIRNSFIIPIYTKESG